MLPSEAESHNKPSAKEVSPTTQFPVGLVARRLAISEAGEQRCGQPSVATGLWPTLPTSNPVSMARSEWEGPVQTARARGRLLVLGREPELEAKVLAVLGAVLLQLWPYQNHLENLLVCRVLAPCLRF